MHKDVLIALQKDKEVDINVKTADRNRNKIHKKSNPKSFILEGEDRYFSLTYIKQTIIVSSVNLWTNKRLLDYLFMLREGTIRRNVRLSKNFYLQGVTGLL